MFKKNTDTKKLIESLTPKQETLIPGYVDRFTKIGLCTRITDRAKAEIAILKGYDILIKAGKLRDPKRPIEVFWAESPILGATLVAQMVYNRKNVTKEEIKEQLNNASFGSFEAYWVSMYAFIAEQFIVEKDPLIDCVLEGTQEWGLYWTFDAAVVLTPKPKAIHIKDSKLHNTEGMALEYHNGEGLYAYSGEVKGSLIEIILAMKNEETSLTKGRYE